MAPVRVVTLAGPAAAPRRAREVAPLLPDPVAAGDGPGGGGDRAGFARSRPGVSRRGRGAAAPAPGPGERNEWAERGAAAAGPSRRAGGDARCSGVQSALAATGRERRTGRKMRGEREVLPRRCCVKLFVTSASGNAPRGKGTLRRGTHTPPPRSPPGAGWQEGSRAEPSAGFRLRARLLRVPSRAWCAPGGLGPGEPSLAAVAAAVPRNRLFSSEAAGRGAQLCCEML